MRISSLTMFSQSATSINKQQSDFLQIGQKMASGNRMLTPSDDPQAATQALGLSQSKAITEQFADARLSATNALSLQENALSGVTDVMVKTKALMVQAANDTLSDSDRNSIAAELRGVLDTVLSQANATDGNGSFLFGGYQDNSTPFVKDVAGTVAYVGDSNDRQVRIDSSRLMEVANNGDSIFRSVQSGAGYLAEADAGNTGSLTFAGPNVIDASDPGYGLGYIVDFSVAGATTTYSVNGGAPVAYQPGEAISIGGLSVSFDGVPADGDSVTIDKASQMNSDIFATLEKIITALESPTQTDAEKANLSNTISTTTRKLDNSVDNILTMRASTGTRLNELEAADVAGDNKLLTFEKTLSQLVDLDYVKAVSEYSMRQVGLQAAQKTFVDLSKLSLFSLI
ncbi:MAG: flagellar hook-associated protein FlgL [Porticoccus sp.]|nr:flagellar hook-associated protein FlgL [Porticoccus sp.]MBQ0807744.1 flagellar hook-associated protein FlgL [Porticoccus sp.]